MSSISTMKKYFSKVWTGACSGVMRARASISAGLAIAAVAMVVLPSQASAETRSLKLYYVHTGEKAEIAFKKDGRFLPDGLKRLNVFLRDWRRNEPTRMDPRLFDLIWQVYQSTGSREYITVVSAYRSPATNAMLRSSTRGVAKKSQHMLGRAMDYFIPGVPLAKLRAIGMRYQIGGVGYYPRSGSPFVHMDVGNVRHWPRMSRRELLALFPDGKTVHIPTDGKPLPGYEQALAMIEKRKAGGGTIMMASNSSSRKRKSLFAALFGGGGADEEEDNGDTAAPATARPARQPRPRGRPRQPCRRRLWNSRVKPWLQPFLPAMLRCRCRRRVRKPGLMRRPQRRKRRLPPSMFLCLPTSRKWPRRMPWRSPPPKIRLLLHALPWMPIRHRLPMQACLPH